MVDKPSSTEEEYFFRKDAELKRKMAQERQAKLQGEERERRRALHHMKCPKCGMDLEEISLSDVRVDKCFHCEGLWLDKGEIDVILKKEAGMIGKLLQVFGH